MDIKHPIGCSVKIKAQTNGLGTTKPRLLKRKNRNMEIGETEDMVLDPPCKINSKINKLFSD